MNQDLHERALSAAYKKLPYSPGLHHVEPAIAEYLRVAGLTVVPVRQTSRIVHGSGFGLSYGSDWTETDDERYMRTISTFKSPFDEVA